MGVASASAVPGVLTTGLLISVFWRWWLKERYSEYTRYRGLKSWCEREAVAIPAALLIRIGFVVYIGIATLAYGIHEG